MTGCGNPVNAPGIHARGNSLMQIARVIGTVVATQKHRKFEGAKLLLVQPSDPTTSPGGRRSWPSTASAPAYTKEC